MVPPDWQHPTDADGNFIPLHKPEQFAEDAEHYRITVAAWNDVPGACEEYIQKYGPHMLSGMIEFRADGGDLETGPNSGGYSPGWINPEPVREYYMPQWLPHQRTHFCLYETVTEGTPVSPVFATIEELEAWREEEGE
jgi:hypothetical protein